MKMYWWRTRPNFGDLLTPIFARHFLRVKPIWSPPADAELVMVGSQLDVLPPDWSGLIAGTGKLHDRTRVPTGATVLGVRGTLSARGLPGDFCLGDPGLLADELVDVGHSKAHDLTVVPHWTDTTGVLAKKFAYLNPHVINPNDHPLSIVAQIGSSKKIVSSSLHGLVVADAFGVPRRAEKFPAIDSPHEGGTFKFEDYSSVVGLPIEWGVLGKPSRDVISTLQAELFEMMQELASLC